jgi:rhodanese-related sulfurtransferase
MNTARTDTNRHTLWAQCAGILVAAVLLGWVYNGLTPLRVRPANSAAADAAAPAAIPPTRPAIVRTGVFNETLSLTLERPPASAPAPVRNPIPPAAPQPAVASAKPVIPALKWPEVKALLDAGRIVLVDARLKANFEIGHIPGAVLLPATSSADELRAFAAQYPRDTAFVTYCGSETCHMSLQLAELLVKICGFTNVSHMPGGYAEYTLAGAATK